MKVLKLSLLFSALTMVLLAACDDGGGGNNTNNTNADAPVISNLPAEEAGPAGEADSFQVQATNAGGDALTYEISGTTCSFTTVISSEGLLTWTCGEAEECLVEVRVSDGPGPSDADTGALLIQCSNSFPTIVTTPDTFADEGVTSSYDFTCVDPDGDPLTFAVGDADTCGGSVTDHGNGTATYTFTPSETQGGNTCDLVLLCADSQGSVSVTSQVTVYEVNLAPSITNLPGLATGHWGEPGSFTVTVEDPDLPAQTLAVELVSHDCTGFTPEVTSAGLVTWTCGDTETCAAEISVDDGDERVIATLEIQCTNLSPTIDSTPARTTAPETVETTYEVTCSDDDGDDLLIAVGPADTCGGAITPTGNGSALYSFTPPASTADSTCLVAVTCSDTQDAAGQEVTFQVFNAPGTWRLQDSLSVARYSSTATLLTDGRVLIAGGGHVTLFHGAEIFNPATGTWTPAASMSVGRVQHTATRLADGRVLVAGGNSSTGLTSAVEIYNPVTDTWTPAASLNTARNNHTALLLQNGKVLVVGGFGSSDALTSAELFDPVTGTWTPTGSLQVARGQHSMTLLTDGRVLVAGGKDNTTAFAGAELYDPAAGTWSSTAPMNSPRFAHGAVLLRDGRVLAVAGHDGLGSTLSSAELYDPATGTWTNTGSLSTGRYIHSTTLLSDGRVLVAAGVDSANLSSAEVYDPAMGVWTPTGTMNQGRRMHTATLLNDGRVLVTGGFGSTSLPSVEAYVP